VAARARRREWEALAEPVARVAVRVRRPAQAAQARANAVPPVARADTVDRARAPVARAARRAWARAAAAECRAVAAECRAVVAEGAVDDLQSHNNA